MTKIINLDEKRLEVILHKIHHAQKCSFFLEDVMGKVMDKLQITEDEAIEIIRFMMEHNLINTKSFLPATFLRTGHIRMFPVVLTSKALAMINKRQK